MVMSIDDDTASTNNVEEDLRLRWTSGRKTSRLLPSLRQVLRRTKYEARCVIARGLGEGLCLRPADDYDCGGQMALADRGEWLKGLVTGLLRSRGEWEMNETRG